MISLGIGEAEEPLFENRVFAVPQGQRETEPAFAVGDAQQPILPPAIRPRARMIVRKIIPARPIGRIILAHRPPLPLGQVWPPPLSIGLPRGIVGEALLFCVGYIQSSLSVGETTCGERIPCR